MTAKKGGLETGQIRNEVLIEAGIVDWIWIGPHAECNRLIR
jgi:hypothetical protein